MAAGEPVERSDEDLVATYVASDALRSTREAAFQELVLRYRHRLFAVCIRVLGSPQDAEEAVQETFIRLARHAETFRGEAKLSTWLYRVARNVCTDHVRHDARRPSTPVPDVTRIADAADRDDPITGHDALAAIRSALEQLDERSRMLLLLIAVDGLSYAEAAAATGLAVGTIKSRVSRARARLGELLTATDADVAIAPPEHGDPRPPSRHPGSNEPRGPPA